MTSKLGLAPEALCAILEASAKANVSKLKFGDLEVEFGRAPIPAPIQRGWYGESLEDTPDIEALKAPFDSQAEAPVTAITEDQKKIIAESLRREEIRTKDEQLAFAVIEDPVLAEELIEEEMRQTELLNDVPSERRE